LVGVIDSGIDYANPVFRNADGTTRIRTLWDQSLSENPPEGYVIGTEYTSEQINEALRQPTMEQRRQIVPSQDISGHGTAVAGVAAGSSNNYRGVAYESELIVVKLGISKLDGFPRTTELMQGIDYVVRKALEYQMPVAINISFGNTYGAHDGNSLLEQFIQDMANLWKSVICIGTGNEGNTAGHTSGILNGEYENGKMSTIKNVGKIGVETKNTLFYKLNNAQILNIVIDGFVQTIDTKNVTENAYIVGLIGKTTKGTVINNLHIKNAKIATKIKIKNDIAAAYPKFGMYLNDTL